MPTQQALYLREWRKRNPDKNKQYCSKYIKTTGNDPEKHALRIRNGRKYATSPKGRKRTLRYLNNNQERIEQKRHARALLHQAIYRKEIQRKPCIKCGKPNAEAHHTDYAKPLDVQWLCTLHHKEIEGKLLRDPQFYASIQ